MHNKKTWIMVLVLVVSIGFLAFFKMPARAEEEISVPINEETFKDEDFRTYVKETFDEDKNNVLNAEELEKVTKIELQPSSISSLEGIEYFKNLTSLICTDCLLGTLDLTGNTALEYVDVSQNHLSSLNVQGLSNLISLYCNDNRINELDVSGLVCLSTLDCSNNFINELDVSGLVNLSTLDCSNTFVKTLTLDNPALTKLDCPSTWIETLDLSNIPALLSLDCHDTFISSLDLRYTPNLSSLSCFFVHLYSLDITPCPNLIKAYHGQSYDTTLDECYDVTVYEDGECKLIVDVGDIVILDPPTITVQPSDKTVTVGDSAGFNVVVDGENLEYTWQVSKDNGETWTDVNAAKYPSAKTPMLTFKSTATLNGYLYHCVVSNSAGSVTSSSAKLTVNTVAKPTITTQPSDKSVTVGSTATFAVTASGDGLSYKWQVSKDDGSTWTDINQTKYPSAATATLEFNATATLNGYQYRCVVSNAGGSVNSSAAKLTVTAASKPTITTQPSNKTTTLGKSVTFKVVANGATSYQWEYSKDNGATWTKWSGKTSASLKVTASKTNNGCLYRCKVKNAAGTTTSSSAKLTVSDTKPTVTGQPAAKTVTAGKTVKFTVVAAGSDLTYQWQVSKDGGKTWTNVNVSKYPSAATATLSFKATATLNGYVYRCKIKNSYGTSYSSGAQLTVN